MDAIERKAFKAAADDSCEFSAVIATLSVRDSDGDVILPGAFAGVGPVPVLWGHDQGMVPLGKATIREVGNEVIAEGELVDERACRWLRHDAADGDPVQEWSWGFFPIDSEPGELDGERVRFIRAVDLLEVSGVLRGASVGSRTVGVKSCGCGCGGSCGPEPTPEQRRKIAEAVRIAEQWERRERQAMKRAEDLAAAYALDERLKAAGRQRIKLLPAPAWFRGVVEMVCRDLDLYHTPPVKLFRPVEWHQKADRTLPANVAGAADGTTAAYVLHGMDLAETVEVVAHEIAHLEWPHASEAEVTAWAREFGDWYAAGRPDEGRDRWAAA